MRMCILLNYAVQGILIKLSNLHIVDSIWVQIGVAFQLWVHVASNFLELRQVRDVSLPLHPG